MTEALTHDDVEQLLPAAALEILEGEELVRVTAHARDCADCAQQLEFYRQVLASVATTLPRRTLDPERSGRLKARLLTRARASHPSSPYLRPRAGRRLARAFTLWGGWAMAAGLTGLLLVHHSVHRPLDYGWLAAGILTIIVLALAVYVRHLRTRLSALDRRDNLKTDGQRNPPFP